MLAAKVLNPWVQKLNPLHLAVIGEIGLLCVTPILNGLEYLEGY